MNIDPMDTTFIKEKLLFVVKMHMYGVKKNIYVLLGDLLSMYAVNRSSITACSTGDLNKHLLTDSNKIIIMQKFMCIGLI